MMMRYKSADSSSNPPSRKPTPLAATILMLLLTAASFAQPASRFVLAAATDASGQPLLGLAAEDFVIYEGSTAVDALNATPALYPVAVLMDTTQQARNEFMPMRTAARQFVSRLTGREIALYTFGERSSRVVDFTRDISKVQRAIDSVFARPDADSHVLDALIETAKDIRRKEVPISLIAVLSVGGNDQSSRTPREVFEAVLSSRSTVQIIEMRSPRASGRLTNPRGRRTSTSDRSAEAALGLEEILRVLADRTQGAYNLIYAGSGFQSSLDRLQRSLASEVVLEYASVSASGAAPLKIGTHMVGVTVRGIGLERAP
jgi:hypothetical protein